MPSTFPLIIPIKYIWLNGKLNVIATDFNILLCYCIWLSFIGISYFRQYHHVFISCTNFTLLFFRSNRRVLNTQWIYGSYIMRSSYIHSKQLKTIWVTSLMTLLLTCHTAVLFYILNYYNARSRRIC